MYKKLENVNLQRSLEKELLKTVERMDKENRAIFHRSRRWHYKKESTFSSSIQQRLPVKGRW